MALTEKRADIILQHGVKQDVDPRVIPEGWLLSTSNLRFEKAGRLVTRFGFDPEVLLDVTGADIDDPGKRLAELDEERIRLTEAKLYSKATEADRFADRGRHPRCSNVVRKPVRRYATEATRHLCSIIHNGYRVYAWVKTSSSATVFRGEVWVSVVDEARGAVLFEEQFGLVPSGPGTGSCLPRLSYAGNYIYIFWVEIPGTGTNTLYAKRFDTTDTSPTAFEATLYTLPVLYNLALFPTTCPYDVDTDGTFLYVAYSRNTGGLILNQYTQAFVVNATRSDVTVNPTWVAIRVTVNNVWVGVSDAGPTTTFYRTNTAMVAITGPFTVAGATRGYPIVIEEDPNTTTDALFQYGTITTIGGIDYNVTFLERITNAGASTATGSPLYHFVPASKPFNDGGKQYCAYYFDSTEFNGLYGIFDTQIEAGVGASGARLRPEAYFGFGAGTRFDHFLYPFPQTVAARDDGWLVALGEDSDIQGSTYSLGNFVAWEFDFEDPTRWQAARARNVTTFSGGLPFEYDGRQALELGFPYAADTAKCSIADSASGGSLVAGDTYTWIFVYERYDSKGNRHLSQPSVPISHTMGGAATAVDIRIQTLSAGLFGGDNALLEGDHGRILIYRTVSAGTTFYLVQASSFESPANDMDTHSVTITEGIADLVLLGNEQFYMTGGELGNVPPGPSAAQCTYRNRLFKTDTNVLRWTKPFVDGRGPEFAFSNQLPVGEGDPLTAIRGAESVLLAFTADQCFVIEGQGPDLVGNGRFDPPRPMPFSVGCIEPRSLVTFQDGTMWLSKRGLEFMDRAGSFPEMIGDRVENELRDFPTITSAVVVPEQSQVRFTCVNDAEDDGRILCWDYSHKEWTVYTLQDNPIQDAAMWQDGYVAEVAGVAKCWVENAIFADDGEFIETMLEIGDFRRAGLGGCQRVWQTIFLGEYRNDVTLHISSAYNGLDYGAPVSKTLGVPKYSEGQELAIEYRHRTQECAAWRHKFETTANGVADSAGIAWNAITLVYGVEPHRRKVEPSARM